MWIFFWRLCALIPGLQLIVLLNSSLLAGARRRRRKEILMSAAAAGSHSYNNGFYYYSLCGEESKGGWWCCFCIKSICGLVSALLRFAHLLSSHPSTLNTPYRPEQRVDVFLNITSYAVLSLARRIVVEEGRLLLPRSCC